VVAYRATAAQVVVDEPMTGSNEDRTCAGFTRTDQRQAMKDSTTYAYQVAAAAADARPCAHLHGAQWRARMAGGMGSGFTELMNGTSIKRPARRLGKPAT